MPNNPNNRAEFGTSLAALPGRFAIQPPAKSGALRTSPAVSAAVTGLALSRFGRYPQGSLKTQKKSRGAFLCNRSSIAGISTRFFYFLAFIAEALAHVYRSGKGALVASAMPTGTRQAATPRRTLLGPREVPTPTSRGHSLNLKRGHSHA